MSENDLCDIYRVRNPQSRQYTWRCKTPLIQGRLDYFPISDQLQGQIEAIDIISSLQSDHSTVRIRVNETQYSTKSRSYWKFNKSLTRDDAFVQALRNEVPKLYSESSELADPVMKWDYLKYKIRQFAKQYSIQFGTQVIFRWSRDRNDRTAENAFSAPCFFSEMELKPAAG